MVSFPGPGLGPAAGFLLLDRNWLLPIGDMGRGGGVGVACSATETEVLGSAPFPA